MHSTSWFGWLTKLGVGFCEGFGKRVEGEVRGEDRRGMGDGWMDGTSVIDVKESLTVVTKLRIE